MSQKILIGAALLAVATQATHWDMPTTHYMDEESAAVVTKAHANHRVATLPTKEQVKEQIKERREKWMKTCVEKNGEEACKKRVEDFKKRVAQIKTIAKPTKEQIQARREKWMKACVEKNGEEVCKKRAADFKKRVADFKKRIVDFKNKITTKPTDKKTAIAEEDEWSVNAGISGGPGGRPNWNVGVSHSWEEEAEEDEWSVNAGISGQGGRPNWNVGVSHSWEEEAEEELQGGTFGATVNNGGFGVSGGYNGFTGSISKPWGSGAPTFGAGYQGNLGGGQFNAGVTKGPGGFGANVGYTIRFDEDEYRPFNPGALPISFEEDEMGVCQCFRAPCHCGTSKFLDETDATVEIKKPLLQRKNKKQKEVKA